MRWMAAAMFVAGCIPATKTVVETAPTAPIVDTTLEIGDTFEVKVYGEQDLSGTYRVNGEGTSHVTAAAGRHGAFVVAVSTDYVFSGEADQPYVESDEPAPRSAYGRSKLAGERAVVELETPAAIVRTAWLYGAGGRNFVDTMLALGAECDEVSVVTDQVGWLGVNVAWPHTGV